jgi:hypothetical protein
MRRLGLAVSYLNISRRFSRTSAPLVLCLFFAVAVQHGLGQCDGCVNSPEARVLGVHNDGAVDVPAVTPPTAVLWTRQPSLRTSRYGGSATAPVYGLEVIVGAPECYVRVAPAKVASAGGDVTGILLRLSCHDGNVTPQTMMPSQSYSNKVGLLNFGRQPIPTLLGDGPLASEYSFEHPLGADATVSLGNGLGFAKGMFSVVPGSPYAHFMENYGLPLMVPGTRSFSFGVNAEGQPYLLCTTCHNQHVMSAYSSTPSSPIAGDAGGRTYATYFFAKGPYDPSFDRAPSTRSPETAQFCRQCHLNVANEGNNSLNIRTDRDSR